jgi:hypothetical protein
MVCFQPPFHSPFLQHALVHLKSVANPSRSAPVDKLKGISTLGVRPFRGLQWGSALIWIPAKAGIQISVRTLGSRLRGNDKTLRNGPETDGLTIRHPSAIFSKREAIYYLYVFSNQPLSSWRPPQRGAPGQAFCRNLRIAERAPSARAARLGSRRRRSPGVFRS